MSHCVPSIAIELSETIPAGVAQHGARFNEIGSRGFVVDNELDSSADGGVPSRCWLCFDPECDGGRE